MLHIQLAHHVIIISTTYEEIYIFPTELDIIPRQSAT